MKPSRTPALKLLVAAALWSTPAAAAWAQSDSELPGFSYPYPIAEYAFTSQGQPLKMAYMDVRPDTPNGHTVVLLHGKNFCAATWEGTIQALSRNGYRVVAPDQIGFCKSTKPERYQYSFQQLAANTHALLASLGIDRVIILGHSTGGMLGTRYALMYPDAVERLAMVNPIGLEDWKALGVPAASVDQQYERELKTTAERVRAYEQSTYYAGEWRPEFDKWVNMYAGQFVGAGREIVARNTALIDDMIYTQPVVYEFPLLKVPVLLLIGQKDTTAIGKEIAPADVRAKLGHYPELGKATAAAIKNARLIEFPSLGHAPQIQDPDAFHKALLDGIGEHASR
ncbi:MAG: alpha/beta hydrolase [Methylobacteriaceae bacterium]|nr:alpha/beta hydrolase [Methylobacteriaceae bacterium]